MARLVVAAAAAVVGFYIGGPAGALQGFALAYGATGFLDPNSKVLGPKLSDLKAPQATFGAPIPYLRGTPRLAGDVIYASAKREIATTQTQGKGGPGVDSTTFTYEIDLMVEVAINRGVALRRVWSNGGLVWTNADDADAESFTASALTTSWRDIRFYDGADDQLPDPTYEAAVGVGNAPAYRGRTTIFIEGLNLGGSGQLPVLTFEVVMEPGDHEYIGIEGVTVTNGVGGVGGGGIGTASFDPAGYTLHIPMWDAFFNTNEVNVYSVTDPPTRVNTYSVPSSITLRDILGTSDVSCYAIHIAGGPPGQATIYEDDSTPLAFDFSGVVGVTARDRFARRGSAVVFGSQDPVGDKKLYRASVAGGASLVESAALPDGVQALAISSDGFVYAVVRDGATVYKLDLATLTLQDTFAAPGDCTDSALGIACDGADVYLRGTGLWLRGASGWNTITTALPLELRQIGGDVLNLAVIDGVLFSVYRPAGGSPPFPNTVWAYRSTTPARSALLSDVVRDLCTRTGQLEVGDVDVTALAADNVRALAVSQVSTTRTTLEMLMGGYLFEANEGETLKFVKRGGASVLTIPYADLAASPDGNAEPLPLKRSNDIEIAARVSVKFANVLNDFQDGLVQADRLVTQSTAESLIELPIGFTPTEAARLADANTMDAAVSLIQIGPVALPRKYAALEPTDVITLTDATGDTFRARIVKGTIGAGVYAFELLLDDATVINSAAATDSDYASSTLVRLLAGTDVELLDVPILRDADNSPGFYAAFSATGSWPGAELDKSPDDVTYTKILDVGDRAVIGRATSTLGGFTGNGFDEVSSVTVDVGGGTLSSSTRDALLASNVNALLVGFEIVQFRTAALQSPGVYLLTGLRRGLRGTEWAIPGHVADERVVLLQATGIRRVAEAAADIGVPDYWKAVTHGKSRAEVDGELFTDTGIALKPFAPVDLRMDTSNNSLVVSWHRRSRLDSRLFGTVDPPLGEASERYDVELRDASDNLQDSVTVSEPVYSASGLAGGAFIVPPIWGMRTIGGDRIAVRDDLPYVTRGTKTIVKLDALGGIAQESPVLGEQVYQWTNNGDSLYAVTAEITGSPAIYVSSKVVKLTRASVDTIDATLTAGTPGDYAGIAHDGTNPWISERTSGNLRKLNATTLASVAAYAIAGAPTALQYDSGKLWVLCETSKDLVKWDIATQTEDARVALGDRPHDLLIAGSHVYVACAGVIKVFDLTGALVATDTYTPAYTLPQRTFCTFGTFVVAAAFLPSFVGGVKLLFITASTGALANVITAPNPTAFFFPAGESVTDLYLTSTTGPGASLFTRKYAVATPGLAGYSITVWQNSATVGRGYPATLEL